MIVNADDFGRHVRINEAVEKGVEMGVLRSATLMAGAAAFEDAAERVRRLPKLGLGIHFTLVDVFPVLPP
ncbi:MAG: ChbG/HpnK family deacetylase, partial [Selenomonas sp.]